VIQSHAFASAIEVRKRSDMASYMVDETMTRIVEVE
jgi:hypothetical protein